MLNHLWVFAALTIVGCGFALAAEPIGVEDGREAAWKGEPATKSESHQPPAGKPRPGIRFSVPEGAKVTWSRSLELDLSGAQSIAFRAWASGPVDATLAFTSGEGEFVRGFRLVRGEQIVMLPSVTFTQSKDAGGWNAVDGAALTLSSANKDARVVLLGIDAVDQEEPVSADVPLLYHPTSQVTETAVAYPLYAIIDTAKVRRGGGFGRALSRYLQQVTGRKLPVNPEGLQADKDVTNVFLLGREAALAAGTTTPEELEKWGYSGFVIKADSPLVTIAGKTRHGVGYGIYRFLEKQGCRFYGHRSADVVPVRNSALLQWCELADKPRIYIKGGPGRYATRGWTSELIGNPAQIAPEGLLDQFWLDHTAAYLVPKRIYHDEHPEYYSQLSDGEHLPKTTPDVRLMLCLSNPDVLRISAERALEWIEAQSDREVFCITQADGPDWCTCENCAKLGNPADQTLHWVNHVARKVAEKYPDKILMTFAYNGSEKAPTRYKPERNVVICYAAWPNEVCAPNSLANYDHPSNETCREQLLEWLEVAPGQMGIYEYHGGGRMTLYSMANRIKWMAKHDMHAVWYCGLNKMWPGVFSFVHGRLCWDPYEDVAFLKNDFIRAFYGEAAPVVIELFDTMYDRLMLGGYEGVHPPREYFEAAFVDRVYDLFERALEQTKGNAGAQKNLLQTREFFINNGLRLRPGFEGELTDDQYKAFGRNLREFVHKVWLPDYRTKLAEHKAGKSDKAPSFKSLANRVSGLCYVDIGAPPAEGKLPPRLLELMENPKETVAKHRKNYFVAKTDSGWGIPGIQFRGGRNWSAYGWFCPRRENTVSIYGSLTDVSRCKARLLIDEAPDGPMALKIEGQDSEKAWCPPPRIQIWVNGRKVFDGQNEFPKRDWAWKEYTIPAGTLQKGENAVEIRNLASTDSLGAHWIMFSEVRIETAPR